MIGFQVIVSKSRDVFWMFTKKFSYLKYNVKLFYSQNPFRCSSYAASQKEKPADAYTTFHKVSSDNWKFVERLLPVATVPPFPQKETYPSGWAPPSGLFICSFNWTYNTMSKYIYMYLNLNGINSYSYFEHWHELFICVFKF